MSPSPQLAPAGSSSYSSDTMTVGDGTWDTSRNTFLLPNLVGLNFDTMRYNGMGNRFRELPGYHDLIRAHGTIAAITFLGVVPAAILTTRFSRSRLRIRYHIWLQILTVLLVIVVFALGTVAVGPSRRLSNPHHGIGTAIFVLVLVQFIWGWWMYRKEKKHRSAQEPLKVTLHHWLGRAVALLALAQIPLGLTLYGSPLVLFILYTLAVFALVLIYFWLTRDQERRGGSDFDSYGTAGSVDNRPPRSRSGGWWKPILAGLGIYAIVNRFSRRRRDHEDDRPAGSVVGASHRSAGSYVDDEKLSRYEADQDRDDRWEDKILKVAGPLGLATIVGNIFERRYQKRKPYLNDFESTTHEGSYLGHGALPPATPITAGQQRPPQAGQYGQVGQSGRPVTPGGPVTANQPLSSSHHPLNRTHSRDSSFVSDDFASASGEPRRSHGLRDGIATLGAIGFAKSLFSRRRSDRDNRRYEEEEEARMQGQHLTGGGDYSPRRHRPGAGSVTESSITNQQPSHPSHTQGIPPIPAGTYAAGTTAAAEAEHERERERRRQEALPLGGVLRPTAMPVIPPDPQGIFHPESVSSESYSSAGGRNNRRHRSHQSLTGADMVGAPPGAAAAAASSSRQNRQDRRQSTSAGEDSGVTSPPVSVRVKMHKDGRHVTLSRLPEAEAEARRRRAANSRSDTGSSLSGDGTGPGFRRREAQDRQHAEAMRIESERLAAARTQAQNPPVPPTPMNVPAPPPIPDSPSGLRPPPGGSVGSPGTYETDASTDYASNRRRRRAERAQARQAKEEREARTGKTVGFEE